MLGFTLLGKQLGLLTQSHPADDSPRHCKLRISNAYLELTCAEHLERNHNLQRFFSLLLGSAEACCQSEMGPCAFKPDPSVLLKNFSSLRELEEIRFRNLCSNARPPSSSICAQTKRIIGHFSRKHMMRTRLVGTIFTSFHFHLPCGLRNGTGRQ